jgi:type IV pilus assembly protein PilM
MAGILEQIKDLRYKLSSLGKSSNLGLDIGSSSLKLAELKKQGSTFVLTHFAQVPLPEDAIQNREILNAIAVGDAIRSAVDEVNPKVKMVAASVGGSSLIVKKMMVEVDNPKELDDQVLWEAEQYIPFDISDVVVDYQQISEVTGKQADVLLAAVKKDVLESMIAVIEDSGLKASVVDADFFALYNCFEVNYPDKLGNTVAIIDIGASSTKLLIASDGSPIFTKEAALGGRTLTHEIAKHLKLSISDAEALKIGDQTQSVPQEVSELMNIASENFAIEIKRSIDFYNASSAGAPVQELLITGGNLFIPGLLKLIEERTGLPTSEFDPFAAIEVDSGAIDEDFLKAIRPIASVSIGLAARGSS